jgi:hypothetical protein
MPIDYSLLALPKGTPKSVEKDQRTAARKKFDDAESEKVVLRSGWQCEIHVGAVRCKRKATEVHHLLGGNGTRARGKSALAIHKQHVCRDCHSAITSNKLYRIGAVLPLWTDSYKRAV